MSMTDQEPETVEPEAPTGMSDEAFEAEWERLGIGKEPADEPALNVEGGPEPAIESETVGKSDSSAGQAGAEGLQGGSEEPPVAFDPVAYADAIDEIRRAGLEPDAFKGKSEGEVIALGSELNTRRRQRDREWQSSQGQSKDEGQNGQDSGDAAQTEQPAAQAAPVLEPDELDATLTPFVEEFGEEAAPVADLLRKLAQQNAALQSRLSQDEQARQLAPIEQAINEELSGSDLSHPDARDKFLNYAKAKADLDGIEAAPGESQADFIRKVIRNANGGEGARREQATKVRTGKPATSTSGNTPSAPKTREEKLQGITDDFFREHYPEHL